ncbi:hypothetical protein JMJ35_010503 [Cladonia borealis]|uniref:Uncharacterized protein n=1 Tax=Cladonia borealis TaxID=184061 RepID=A0AA39V5X0_9LECA|nr:hypothetical protein JMJ35_010503 [Cladonia borealis]
MVHGWERTHEVHNPAISQSHHSSSRRHSEVQQDSIKREDPNTSNISMTPKSLKVLGQSHTGTQTYHTPSSANVALLHSWEKDFNDQDDEYSLESWPQSTPKQSRLMTWIKRQPFRAPTIRTFKAITFIVLSILLLGRFTARSFPRDYYSHQGRGIGPELLCTVAPMGEAFKYRVQTISSSVSAPSNYRGPVSPEVDRAWRELFKGNHIRISPEDMMKMNRTSVRLDGERGDYIATTETYHQLHCLWYIFQLAHPEAYTVERHHGVSFVQCHASASVQTYPWKPETRVPESDVDIPNFNGHIWALGSIQVSIDVMTRVTKLLITVTLFLACAFTAIASGNNNTDLDITTSANAILNIGVVCYTGVVDFWRANYFHCLRATQFLPDGVIPGSFHMQGQVDSFRLPRSVRYGSCMVAVSLESLDGEPDQSTWRTIKNGASQVAAACRSSGVSDLTTGRLLFVGDRGAIKISMEKYVQGPLSVGNSTTGTAIS